MQFSFDIGLFAPLKIYLRVRIPSFPGLALGWLLPYIAEKDDFLQDLSDRGPSGIQQES